MYPDKCPKCKYKLKGDKIPKKSERHYGKGFFRKEIAIYDRNLDKTVAYMCPCCEFRWKREKSSIR